MRDDTRTQVEQPHAVTKSPILRKQFVKSYVFCHSPPKHYLNVPLCCRGRWRPILQTTFSQVARRQDQRAVAWFVSPFDCGVHEKVLLFRYPTVCVCGCVDFIHNIAYYNAHNSYTTTVLESVIKSV